MQVQVLSLMVSINTLPWIQPTRNSISSTSCRPGQPTCPAAPLQGELLAPVTIPVDLTAPQLVTMWHIFLSQSFAADWVPVALPAATLLQALFVEAWVSRQTDVRGAACAEVPVCRPLWSPACSTAVRSVRLPCPSTPHTKVCSILESATFNGEKIWTSSHFHGFD
jgi:hypothetical protein